MGRSEAWRALCDRFAVAPGAQVVAGPRVAPERRIRVPTDTPVLGIAWSPDGRWVAAAGGGRTPGAPGAVRAVEVATGRTLDCEGHQAGAFAVAFHAAGWLASAGHDGRVLLWDLDAQACLTLVPAGTSRRALAIAGDLVAVGDELGASEVRLVDLGTGETRLSEALAAGWFAHALDLADGLLVVAEVHRDLRIRLAAWDVDGTLRWRVPVAGDLLHGVCLAGDLVESVTDARGDRWIRRRSAEDGAVLAEVVAGSSLMGAIAVDRSHNRVASGGSDGRIAVLGLADLTEIGSVESVDPTMALAWSPDGRRLAVGLAQGGIEVAPGPTA